MNTVLNNKTVRFTILYVNCSHVIFNIQIGGDIYRYLCAATRSSGARHPRRDRARYLCWNPRSSIRMRYPSPRALPLPLPRPLLLLLAAAVYEPASNKTSVHNGIDKWHLKTEHEQWGGSFLNRDIGFYP